MDKLQEKVLNDFFQALSLRSSKPVLFAFSVIPVPILLSRTQVSLSWMQEQGSQAQDRYCEATNKRKSVKSSGAPIEHLPLRADACGFSVPLFLFASENIPASL